MTISEQCWDRLRQEIATAARFGGGISLLLTMMGQAWQMSAKRNSVSPEMSGNSMPAHESAPPPVTAPAAGPPTGYRISILPAALEVSARLGTADELQNLVKILQANAAIWGTVAKNEAPPQ